MSGVLTQTEKTMLMQAAHDADRMGCSCQRVWDAAERIKAEAEVEAWEEVAALLRDLTDTFEEHERASILSGATMVRLLAQSRRAALDATALDRGTGAES